MEIDDPFLKTFAYHVETRLTFKSKMKSYVSSLVQRRHDLGLTQPDVDQKIGVATGLTAKWEGGFRSPTSYNLYCWAKALDCELVLVPYPEREHGSVRNRSRSHRRSRGAVH